MTPANPYRSALKLIAILGLSVGALFLLLSAGLASAALARFQESGVAEDLSGGAALSAVGSGLFGMGAIALLLWLVVSSLQWDAGRTPAEPKLTPEEIRERLARKAERG